VILTLIPFSPEKDLGAAYNAAMKRLRSGDWAVFLDHDAMFTTYGWHSQIAEAIKRHPDAWVFTCMTNRIMCKWQKVAGADRCGHDIMHHRRLGGRLAAAHGSTAVKVTGRTPLSGVLMVVSFDRWKAGLRFESGFFGVDNALHLLCRRKGGEVYLLRGLYVYHWYRGDGVRDQLKGVATAKSMKRG